MGKMWLVLVAVLLSGCAGLLPTAQMTAEQLKAVASDSNANATVVSYVGAGGPGTFSTLNTDKGALGSNGGSASVKPNGEINIVVNPKAEAAPRPMTGCAGNSIVRNPDTGQCTVITRDVVCRISGGRAVSAEQCAALRP